jgi:N-acetylneuraminic acid mutarotase
MTNAWRPGWLFAKGLAGFFLCVAVLVADPVHGQGTKIPGTTGPGSWFLMQQMPHQQNEAATAVLEGKIYVIGGFETDGEPITRVQIYDPTFNKWSQGTPLKEGVHHAGAAVAGGKIYLVGGFRNPFQKRDPVDHVWAFDPATKNWEAKAPLPAPRGALMVAAIGDKIYAIGGEHYRPKGTPVPEGAPAPYEPVAWLSIYDTGTDKWQDAAPMKVARDHAYVGVIGGKLYLVGGRDRPKYDIVAIEEFDPATGKWRDRSPMPTGRSGGNAAVLNGKLYVFGGEGKPGNPLGIYNENEAYDAATDRWTKLGPMPFPRHSLSAAAYGNRIYLPGGAPHRSGYDVLSYTDAYEP